jgi:hypothetical protein
MTRTILGALFAAAAGAAVVAAQAQSEPARPPAQDPASPNRPASSQPAQRDAAQTQTVTFTGCLEAGDTPDTWVLTNVTQLNPSQPQSSAPGQPQAGQARADQSMEGQRLKLSGTAAGFDPKSHVSHRVEVTGRLSANEAGSQSARPTQPAGQSQAGQSQAGQAQAGQAQAGQADTQTITLTSAKMISDRCAVQ